MSPSFLPDSYVLSVSHPFQKLKKNDVILVNHPTYGKMIKRILDTTPNGILLIGDNPKSVTTEQMGLMQQSNVLGKVVWHVNPPATK